MHNTLPSKKAFINFLKDITIPNLKNAGMTDAVEDMEDAIEYIEIHSRRERGANLEIKRLKKELTKVEKSLETVTLSLPECCPQG